MVFASCLLLLQYIFFCNVVAFIKKRKIDVKKCSYYSSQICPRKHNTSMRPCRVRNTRACCVIAVLYVFLRSFCPSVPRIVLHLCQLS